MEFKPTNFSDYLSRRSQPSIANDYEAQRNGAWAGLGVAAIAGLISLGIPHQPTKPAYSFQNWARLGTYVVIVGGSVFTAARASRMQYLQSRWQALQQAENQTFGNAIGSAVHHQAALDTAYHRAAVQEHFVQEAPPARSLPPDREEEPPEVLASPEGKDPISLIAALLRLGVNAKWVGEVHGASFRRCRVKLNQSFKPQKIAAVKSLAEDLAAELGLEYTPFISRDGGNIAIDIPRSNRQTLLFSSFIKFNPQPTEPIQIAVGVNLDGQLIYADLSDTDTCHILVGGTTGSGKTEFLKAAIASLIWRYSPDKVQVIIVDPKRTKYNDFAGLSWLYCPIVKDVEGAISLMSEMVEEMEKRYQLFENNGCENLDGYLKKTVKELPRIVVVYDEFADFMGDKEDKAVIELSAKRLGQKAREAGIHLILATQRPDKDVVTPILRSNLPGRIALRVKSEGDSNIILGDGENAHHLLGKGDLLYQTSGGTVRLQSLFLDDISCLKKSDVRSGEKGDRKPSAPTSPAHSAHDPHISAQTPHTLLHKSFTQSAHPHIRTLEEAILAVEAWLATPHTSRTPLFIGRPREEILLLFKALLHHKAGKIKTIEYGWGVSRGGGSQKYKDAKAMYLALLAEASQGKRI